MTLLTWEYYCISSTSVPVQIEPNRYRPSVSSSLIFLLLVSNILHTMPPRGNEGLDFTPILTHYLFLFTTILAIVSSTQWY